MSALDGENIDVFKNSSFTCAARCHPQLLPIGLQLEFQSTRPSTSYYPPHTLYDQDGGYTIGNIENIHDP